MPILQLQFSFLGAFRARLDIDEFRYCLQTRELDRAVEFYEHIRSGKLSQPDRAAEEKIEVTHLAEAIQYRARGVV
ncbi:hypothetical protein GC175_31885 [bacterium]|nr:hypothetical protein [bacterium]